MEKYTPRKIMLDLNKGCVWGSLSSYYSLPIIVAVLKKDGKFYTGEVKFYADVSDNIKDKVITKLNKYTPKKYSPLRNWYTGANIKLVPKVSDLFMKRLGTYYLKNYGYDYEITYRDHELATYNSINGKVIFKCKSISIKKMVMSYISQYCEENPMGLAEPSCNEGFTADPYDYIDREQIYTDDNDVVYGSKTIGYCMTNNGNFTGDIKFKSGIDERLKKAVIDTFNNSFYRSHSEHEWREVIKESNSKIENRLAESFEKTFKDLQKEGLFESVKSFDLDFTGKGINIKLNENTTTAPTIEELDQLETQFYNLVSACEKEDNEYRSKYSNIYLVYLDSSSSEHDHWIDDEGKEYTDSDIDWDDDDNEVINGIPLDQFKGTGGTAVIDFPMYSLDEPEKALNGNGRLVGVMCEYLAEEADPKSLFMSKLKINNFVKKFCNKYHLTPMFYVGSRNRGDKNWENKGADICSNIWETIWDPNIDGYYDACEISGPFGVEYDSSLDY